MDAHYSKSPGVSRTRAVDGGVCGSGGRGRLDFEMGLWYNKRFVLAIEGI
jgi:hypothetical protein